MIRNTPPRVVFSIKFSRLVFFTLANNLPYIQPIALRQGTQSAISIRPTLHPASTLRLLIYIYRMAFQAAWDGIGWET